jgi:gluconate 2-dehydrogenase gamma chain
VPRFHRRELLLAAAAVLAACALRRPGDRADTLDAIQRDTVAALCDTIIPETDTPGAIEAGVPAFIETLLSQWCTADERETFVAGLAFLDGWCAAHRVPAFRHASPVQRAAALSAAERQATLARDDDDPFFTMARELVVVGYYTSRVGATQELRYNPMPGRYADISFASVGRQWSR